MDWSGPLRKLPQTLAWRVRAWLSVCVWEMMVRSKLEESQYATCVFTSSSYLYIVAHPQYCLVFPLIQRPSGFVLTPGSTFRLLLRWRKCCPPDARSRGQEGGCQLLLKHSSTPPTFQYPPLPEVPAATKSGAF